MPPKYTPLHHDHHHIDIHRQHFPLSILPSINGLGDTLQFNRQQQQQTLPQNESVAELIKQWFVSRLYIFHYLFCFEFTTETQRTTNTPYPRHITHSLCIYDITSCAVTHGVKTDSTSQHTVQCSKLRV